MQTNINADAVKERLSVAAETPPKSHWRKDALHHLANKLTPHHSPDSATPIRQRLRLVVICAAIFSLAFCVRLLHWQDTRVETLQEDSMLTSLVRLYENEAKRMEDDGGVIFPSQTVDPGDARMLVHPPGYSILLKVLYGTTPSTNHYFALRMIQVVSDALAAVLLFLVVLELFPLGLAIISGTLAALSPHFADYALWLSPDSLPVPLILLGVLFFIKASKQPRLATLIASGTCFGLACWLRSNPLLLAPLLAVTIFFTFEKGKRLRSAAALVLATACVISPITLRNWMVYHRFIPLTIVTGLNLIQGLAEFDKENRFGLPPMDADAMAKDVEWHERPEYARNLFVPDGIERDHYRFKRGLEVIQANPGWFTKGMMLRMAFMLRYNDFRPQNNNAFTTIAPTILPHPGFSHAIEVSDGLQPTWTASPVEMLVNFVKLSPQVDASLAESELFQLQGNELDNADQMMSPPIPVKEYSDYILTLPVRLLKGRAALTVRSLDSRIGLRVKIVSKVAKRDRANKQKAKARSASDEKFVEAELPVTVVQIPFSSANNQAVRLYMGNNGATEQTLLQVGEAQLFEIGPTTAQWTRPPRSLFRGLQKNIFKTDVMRWLIILGLLLLAFARRRNALLILLTVPIYYLVTHAAFSTEYRYILAIHAFLFVMAAVTLYIAGVGVQLGLMKALGNLNWFKQAGRENQTPTIS